MSSNEIIVELVEMIIMQEKEIESLRKRIERVNKYLEVYEEYIKRG